MRAVKSKNTTTEMVVRRLVHALGYRYRLHRKDLPGVPDLVFPSRRAVIFVHGCFWHQHECPRGARIPKTRRDYWTPKLRKNQKRDRQHQEHLHRSGWRVLVIWECEINSSVELADRLSVFLNSARSGTRTVPPAESGDHGPVVTATSARRRARESGAGLMGSSTGRVARPTTPIRTG